MGPWDIDGIEGKSGHGISLLQASGGRRVTLLLHDVGQRRGQPPLSLRLYKLTQGCSCRNDGMVLTRGHNDRVVKGQPIVIEKFPTPHVLYEVHHDP